MKTCKVLAASFPLLFKQAELVEQEMDFNPLFIRSILPRVDWDALRVIFTEVLSILEGGGGGGGSSLEDNCTLLVSGRMFIPVMEGGIDTNHFWEMIVWCPPLT